MSAPPSYTRVTHSKTYAAINPTQPGLSTAGKVVLITGASGGIGRATALSFAASRPRAIILVGRVVGALIETKDAVLDSHPDTTIQWNGADVCEAQSVRSAMKEVITSYGTIDIVVHCAGVLAPVVPLREADPDTFLDGYKTTVVGTLVTAQEVVRANKIVTGKDRPVTFINLTTAGVLFPPFPGMGAYVSSKMASVKVLECFAVENPQVRLHNVHPGFLQTAMSAKLAEKIKLPYLYDHSKWTSSLCLWTHCVPFQWLVANLVVSCAVSLPADFLVWIASPEAQFLKDKIVFASWDVDELKSRKKEIVGAPLGSGELCIGFQGFPRFVNGQPVQGAQ